MIFAEPAHTVRSFATARPDNPITQTGVRAEWTHDGLGARLGRNRADVAHHRMDPVIVAGPWALGVVMGRRVLRRVARRG